MEPALRSMIGLGVDVVGAFFLSAEVIGVKNLNALVNKIIRPLDRSSRRYLVGLKRPLPLRYMEYPSVRASGGAVFFIFLLALWTIGLAVISLTVILVARPCISVVRFVDNHTADGGVGIVGFLLLMCGFSLQFYGTYLSL